MQQGEVAELPHYEAHSLIGARLVERVQEENRKEEPEATAPPAGLYNRRDMNAQDAPTATGARPTLRLPRRKGAGKRDDSPGGTRTDE